MITTFCKGGPLPKNTIPLYVLRLPDHGYVDWPKHVLVGIRGL